MDGAARGHGRGGGGARGASGGACRGAGGARRGAVGRRSVRSGGPARSVPSATRGQRADGRAAHAAPALRDRPAEAGRHHLRYPRAESSRRGRPEARLHREGRDADRAERRRGADDRARSRDRHRARRRLLRRAARERGHDGAADGREGEGMRRLGGAVVLLVFGALGAAPRPVWSGAQHSDPLLEDGAPDEGSAPESHPGVAGEPAGAAPSAWLGLRDVRVEPAGDGRRLVIAFTRAPEGVHDFALKDPPRLVFDVRGPQSPKANALTRFPVRDDVVSGVRVASNAGALRVVADMHEPVPYHVHPEGSSLVVDIGAATAGTPPTAQVPPSSIASEPLGDAPATKPGAAKKKAAKNGAVAGAATAPVKPAVANPTETEQPVDQAAAAPAEPAAAPAATVRAPALVPEPVAAPAEPRTVKLTPARPEGVFNGQRISLDFKDADIQNVLRVLADVSGLNIIATDDVKGKVTLHLSDVPWDQALDLVLRSNRLEKTRDGNVVRISTVARLKEEREALRAAQDAEKELEPLRVKYLRVNYARADETLVDKVKGVLTDRGSVTFDERTNTIVIRDIPHGIEDATDLVRELDVQSPQVLIEANLVEATRDVARALGISWGYIFNAGPQTGNPTGLTFPGTVGLNGSGLGAGSAPPSANGTPRLPVPFLSDFSVPTGFTGFGPGTGSSLDLALGSLNGANTLTTRLTALEEEGKAKIISLPRVITMNNVAATIQSQTILRVKLPSTGTVINT